MSRKKGFTKRERLPDPKFKSVLVTQFINNLMRRGKRSLAENVFYETMDLINKKTSQPGLDVFNKALNNVKPLLEVKSRRVGGATYQIPIEVRADRRTALAIRWVIGYAKERSEHTMPERLAAELVAASKNEGTAIKKKEDTHKMAEANKAFAHFRW
ncbi:MAG TPA: 30S ribosomal protein S7 [candidate division Zixibacteria bacterium]